MILSILYVKYCKFLNRVIILKILKKKLLEEKERKFYWNYQD